MTSAEISHSKKVQIKIIISLFVSVLIAGGLSWYYETSYLISMGGILALSLFSVFCYFSFGEKAYVRDLLAVTTMLASAFLMYAGRGIAEAHFFFFVFMTFITAFNSVRAILAAVVTVSAHHLSFYFFIPGAGFPEGYAFANYSLHFVAAVAQAVPGIFIALDTKKAQKNQEELSRELSETANQNLELSQKISNSSGQVSSSLSSQASQLQSAASAATELKQTMDSTVDQFNTTSSTLENILSRVESNKESTKNLSTLVSGIELSNEKVQTTVDSSLSRLKETANMVDEIAEKTKVINDIVFQTKLLSFNASVEAARAGEHGKGFAVVAEEIGALAKLSGDAAFEINTLVENGKSHTNDVAEQIGRQISSIVKENSGDIRSCAEVSEQLVTEMIQMAQKLNENGETIFKINSAFKEQLNAVSEVSTSVEEIDSAFRVSVEAVKESANAAISLSERSNGVLKLISSIRGDSIHKKSKKQDVKTEKKFKRAA